MKKLALLLLAVLALSQCKAPGSTGTDSTPTSWSIRYEATGSTTYVDLTYENATGGTSQESGRPVPWSYSFTGHAGDFVYISAQKDGGNGTVTVTIYRDGIVFKTSTSIGAYVIATAYDLL